MGILSSTSFVLIAALPPNMTSLTVKPLHSSQQKNSKYCEKDIVRLPFPILFLHKAYSRLLGNPLLVLSHLLFSTSVADICQSSVTFQNCSRQSPSGSMKDELIF